MSMFDEGLTGSESRLWELIAKRQRPDTDTAQIDRRIWDLFGEDWCIMFTDLVGFSRNAARFGIIHFLQIIYQQKDLLLPIVSEHDGILIKMEADSFLIIFRRPERGLACAIAMQQASQEFSAELPPERKLLLCIGLGYGKILRTGDTDVWGAEVNAASKLGEDTATQHQILVTGGLKDVAAAHLTGISFKELDLEIPGAERTYETIYPHF